MSLQLISGPVSNVQQETEVYGAQSSNTGATKFHSQKLINFRVGNRPVTMKLKSTIDIADGDEVTVVGSGGSGVMKGVIVRNDGTGIVYGHSTLGLLTWGVLLIAAGIATFHILVGFAIAPMGLYLVFKGIQNRKARSMLAGPALGTSATPAP